MNTCVSGNPPYQVKDKCRKEDGCIYQQRNYFGVKQFKFNATLFLVPPVNPIKQSVQKCIFVYHIPWTVPKTVSCIDCIQFIPCHKCHSHRKEQHYIRQKIANLHIISSQKRFPTQETVSFKRLVATGVTIVVNRILLTATPNARSISYKSAA